MDLTGLIATSSDEGGQVLDADFVLDKRSPIPKPLTSSSSPTGLGKGGGGFNSSRSPPVRSTMDHVQSGRVTKVKNSCPSTSTESMLRDEIKLLKNTIKAQQDTIQSKDEEIALLRSTSYRSSGGTSTSTPTSSSAAAVVSNNNNNSHSHSHSHNRSLQHQQQDRSGRSSGSPANNGAANYSNQFANYQQNSNAEAERNALIAAQQQQQGQARLMEQLMAQYSAPQNPPSFEQQLQVLQLLRSNPEFGLYLQQQQQEQQLRWYKNFYTGQS